jgi:DNA-binding transcriptional ArsR family regulator
MSASLPSAASTEQLLMRCRDASAVLKALGHEIRLLILFLLADGEMTVTELKARLGLQQAVVSQHLARLRVDRLVDTRRSGRLAYYSISNHEIASVVALLQGTFLKGRYPGAVERS